LAIVLSVLNPACQDRAGQTLTLAGSTSLQPLVEKWADAYHDRHPQVVVAVQGGGSTAGAQAAISGAAQIGLSSRALTRDEQLVVRSVPVARDGIAMVVHPANPLSDLSLAELRAMYAGRTQRWSRLRAGGPAITLITREEGSGTRAAFESLVMGHEQIAASALVQDSTGAVRQMVSSDPAAIGYISMGLADASLKKLRLSGSEATEANIDSGAYPLFRPFLFVLRGDPPPLVGDFITFVSSREGLEITRREGMLPPAGDEARADR
jgi:phosphate transport system substrate-binding protein